MQFSLSISRRLLATLAGFALAPGLLACGPDFPNCYLSNSFDELSKLPALSFENELAQFIPIKRWPEAEPAAEDEEERTEVRRALLDSGMSAGDVDLELSDYRREKPPARLPREFHLYAHGAQAWRENRRDAALAAWRELLALPASERRFRSVWAAFMIGRALADTDPAAARDACRLARESAAGGFADSRHLAEASLGWEARAYLNEHDYLAALRRYSQQLASGASSAIVSLQLTLVHIFNDDPMATPQTDSAAESEPLLSAIAADHELRRIVTAWFASRGGRGLRWGPEAAKQFRRWIGALPNAKDLAPDEADRWCWAAYQNGMWNEARALAATAPRNAPASEWVRAMLLLRAGSVDDAADHLSTAAAGFATDSALSSASPLFGDEAALRRPLQQPLGAEPTEQLAGVRGVLALHRMQYVEALRLFLSAGHWSDAAYVAERVLTADELVGFTTATASEMNQESAATSGEQLQRLRHLTARRLVRLGQFERAKEFFPPDVGEHYRDYLANVRLGFDPKTASRTRADALWAAAKVIHESGMGIQGTELEPDYGVWDGNHQWPQLGRDRNSGAGAGDWWREEAAQAAASSRMAPVQPSSDELERLKATCPPNRRFHYRYRAAELAWLSAALLPNDDEETATILHTAGLWMANRDPAAADLFYKTLVIRCPNTELGRRAAARHWFVRESPAL